MNKNCTSRGVLRKMSVYTVATAFSGLTPQGFHFTVMPRNGRRTSLLGNDSFEVMNSRPRRISAIPKRTLRKGTKLIGPVTPSGFMMPIGA